MTNKEKAKELVDRFKKLDTTFDGVDILHHDDKQCALLCVDEMIKQNGKYNLLNGGELTKTIYNEEQIDLFEIKKEINKL